MSEPYTTGEPGAYVLLGDVATPPNVGEGCAIFHDGTGLKHKDATGLITTIVEDGVGIPGGNGQAFPVGSVFIAVVVTSPTVLLGYGVWTPLAQGRMLVGQNPLDTDFDTAMETGGAKTVTLQANEMPSHTHVQDPHSHVETNNSATTGPLAGWGARDTSTNSQVATGYSTEPTTAVNQVSGGGAAHNNMPPYLVVHMWERTA